jgi:tetratricopeptide (TPR) repeat protein
MDSVQIDSLENRNFQRLSQKTGKVIDSVLSEAAEAMQTSERLGYTHGKAVALAVEAIVMNLHVNDFIRAEGLARQSLETFRHTGNQGEVALAYYALGFSLFAQSRYDEALHCYEKARDFARQSGNYILEVHMLSQAGEDYRERGDYEKAFDIQQQCVQLAETIHDTALMKGEYLTLAELFVQIEDYTSAEKYFLIGFGAGKPDQPMGSDGVCRTADASTQIRQRLILLRAV